MGKKQKEQRGSTKLGSQANQEKGGVRGQKNALAAKNDFNIVDQLKNGRHECLCQARIHELVRNCLGCGRIVCAQEGSGPCFTCGTLVCTREEMMILKQGDKKSRELSAKLMGATIDGTRAGSLQGISQSYQDAKAFKDKLLEADADTERRTKVTDLESDYSNAESSPFLSAVERKALVARREELRIFREKERTKFVVNIDLNDGIVQQMEKLTTTEGDIGKDPVIQRIMEMADERRRAQEAAYNSSADARWNPIGFIPKYMKESGRQIEPNSCSDGDVIDAESLMIVSDDIAAQIVEDKGWTIALEQPCASFLVNGLIRFIRWNDDVMLKGPLFIAAKAKSTNEEEITGFVKKYVRDTSKVNGIDFANGSILGRAFLEDCLMLEDFYDKFGSKSEIPGDGDFVLCFNSFEPLVGSVPHIPSGDLYELDRQLKKSLTSW